MEREQHDGERRRSPWPRVRARWVPPPIAFLVVGALLLAMSAAIAWQQQQVPDGWVKTKATIIASADYTNRPSVYRPSTSYRTVEFRDQSGRTAVADYEGGGELGERMTIAYNPRDPERIRVLDANWQVLVLFAAMGGVAILAGLFVALLTFRPARYRRQRA